MTVSRREMTSRTRSDFDRWQDEAVKPDHHHHTERVLGFAQSLRLLFAGATAAVVFVMAGCTSDREVSATVTAESTEHGKVRSPTAGEPVDPEETMRKMAQVDS